MLHKRPEKIAATGLRVGADKTAEEVGGRSALQDEVVEVVDPKAGETNGFVKVRLSLSGAEGWIRTSYLHSCPEGTKDHGRLSSEGAKTGDREVEKRELPQSSSRFKEVAEFVQRGSGGKLKAKRVWFIKGHFIGETGMVNGPKETHFHGTDEDAIDNIIKTGFDDEYSADGKFGPGIYFSPEAMTSYSYGQLILLCEAALGREDQRITAEECTSEYNLEKLLKLNKRSVQCHVKHFGQEERIVYHCTQCKPVYQVDVEQVDLDHEILPRWLQHRRPDTTTDRTGLRTVPDDDRKHCIKPAAYNGEVVEVLPPFRVQNGYVNVQLAVTGQQGWINRNYLHHCPEGTAGRGKTAAGSGGIKMVPTVLKPGSLRFREIEELIKDSWCVPGGCKRQCGKDRTVPKPSSYCMKVYDDECPTKWEVEEVTMLEGQYLGKTGMATGMKEVLFHGCKDSTIPLILANGFDLDYCSVGAFGQGNYFSPQACKAFTYSYDKANGDRGRYILVCEVALGTVENRKVLTASDTSLKRQKVFIEEGFRSAVHHVDGGCFKHEECIIYWNTQCKPTYLVKMKGLSPASGV